MTIFVIFPLKSGDLTPVGVNEEWKLTRRRLRLMETKHKVLRGVVRRQVAGFKKVRCANFVRYWFISLIYFSQPTDHIRAELGPGQPGEPGLRAAVTHRQPEREAEGAGQEDRRSGRQVERRPGRRLEEEETRC